MIRTVILWVCGVGAVNYKDSIMYLFIFALVVSAPPMGGPGYTYTRHYSWQNQGFFSDLEACNRAAATLALKKEIFRCVSKS